MKAPICIYIHIPYCVSKCPYCDFNSYAVGQDKNPKRLAQDETAYTAALVTELDRYANIESWKGRSVQSIFFGGGTPSLFTPESIGQILAAIKSSFPVKDNAEITLEANPGTIFEDLGQQRLLGFRSKGINRISMGAQSFNEKKLKLLGRLHSATEIKQAVANVVSAGFNNYNLDLIFGVHGETLESWVFDLESALALSPNHISAYGLTLEPGTVFYQQHKKGSVLKVDEDLEAEMYITTQKLLTKNGYEQYEISNYSKPGFHCRHNLSYWKRHDYIGLGAGAHSFLGSDESTAHGYGARWSNLPGPSHYIESVNKLGHARNRIEEVSKDQAELEFFSLGLRTAEGIDLDDYQNQFGDNRLQEHKQTISKLAAEDLVMIKAQHAKLTQKGFLFADTVFSSFL